MAKIENFNSIQKLIDKIGKKADELKWEELTDCAVDAYNKYEDEESCEKIFFECNQYLMRLWLRVKDYDKKYPIDKVVRTYDEYIVYGYSLSLFVFARNHVGMVSEITNDRISFDIDKMTDAVKMSFDKKIDNEE